MTDAEKKALAEQLAALRKMLADVQAIALKAEAEVRNLKRQIEEITRPFLTRA